MSHDHANQKGNIKRVQFALFLTATFMLVEVVGGILSGSLALLADAGHMLTDTMALALICLSCYTGPYSKMCQYRQGCIVILCENIRISNTAT